MQVAQDSENLAQASNPGFWRGSHERDRSALLYASVSSAQEGPGLGRHSRGLSKTQHGVHAYNPITQELRQEVHESQTSMGYTTRPSVKKQTTKKKAERGVSRRNS
jgi:hypothetical protein